jgi:hypothetical protein
LDLPETVATVGERDEIEIRSYRAVFDLERRIYRIDRLRLNPAGVPVRGVLYFVGVIGCAMLAGRLPLVGLPVGLIPWYLRDVAVPGAVAALLTVVKVDGRPFHLYARALLRYGVKGHELAGLVPGSSAVREWRMDELVMLVDGSDSRLRHMRYSGPGVVQVRIAHVRTVLRPGPLTGCLRRPHVLLATLRGGSWLAEGQTIVLRRETRLGVRA